ncbi:hypothetical protein [Romboutsia sp.]|uniref:hypothetical protein n=1 Tax=Romboutsia sp. TaxID=1965302 RepID=UPI002BBE69DB|nr:hypothetical protein [Romboutsia sp.]HSQ90209.1 hypothetical protein [Romboutsia sp.]
MFKLESILVDECAVCVMPVCELEGNSEHSQGYFEVEEFEMVTCDHCGLVVEKTTATPCTWEEFNLTWYYCERCNKIFEKNELPF